MSRRLSLALLALLAARPALASTSWVSGIGTEACAQWTADQDNAVAQYSFGYFTGVNATLANQGHAGLVGSRTDGPSLLAALRDWCHARPQDTLAVAVALTYNRIAAHERTTP